MPDLLTVPAFAELAGVSHQAIYQQASNPNSRLAPYVDRTGRKVMIDAAALADLYGVEQPDLPNQASEASQTQPDSTSLARDYINHLENELQTLRAQNKELNDTVQSKDELIKDQAAQLADLAHKVTAIAEKALTATSQQQYLSALEKGSAAESQANSTESQPQSTPKASFWKRLFG